MDELTLLNGHNPNQALVRAGLAWWYQQYASKDTALAQLEAEGQQAEYRKAKDCP